METEEVKIPEKKEIADELKRRINRRRMAWISLISLDVVTLCMLFFVQESRLGLLNDLVEMFFLCTSSIVLSYLGVATWTDVTQIKRGR